MNHITHSAPEKPESVKVYLAVYFAILAIAGIQVAFAYHTTSVGQHVIRMLSLAIIQGGLAVAVFMHVMKERRIFLTFVIPVTIFVLLMMNMIWSDSFRLIHMRPFPN